MTMTEQAKANRPDFRALIERAANGDHAAIQNADKRWRNNPAFLKALTDAADNLGPYAAANLLVADFKAGRATQDDLPELHDLLSFITVRDPQNRDVSRMLRLVVSEMKRLDNAPAVQAPGFTKGT